MVAIFETSYGNVAESVLPLRAIANTKALAVQWIAECYEGVEVGQGGLV